MGIQESILARPAHPQRGLSLTVGQHSGDVAKLPVLSVWAIVIDCGVTEIPLLCRRCASLQQHAVAASAQWSCANLEQQLSDRCAVREQGRLRLLMSSLPPRVVGNIHRFLVPSGPEHRRSAGALQILDALHCSYRKVLRRVDANDALHHAMDLVLTQDQVNSLLALAGASIATSHPAHRNTDAADCMTIMLFFRAYVVLATRHAQLSSLSEERVTSQGSDILLSSARVVAQRAPDAARALRDLRLRYRGVSPYSADMEQVKLACNATNALPVCLPFATEYNAFAKTWRSDRLNELEPILEGIPMSELLAHPTVKRIANEHGVSLTFQEGASRDDLRKDVMKAICYARPLLQEGFEEDRDDRLFLANFFLLPPSLSTLLAATQGVWLPKVAAVYTAFGGTLQAWAEFVSKRHHRLAHFLFQSRNHFDDEFGYTAVEVCEFESVGRVQRLAFQSIGNDSTLLEDGELPCGRFGPELPFLFRIEDDTGDDAHNVALVKRSHPCVIL